MQQGAVAVDMGSSCKDQRQHGGGVACESQGQVPQSSCVPGDAFNVLMTCGDRQAGMAHIGVQAWGSGDKLKF